MQRQTIGRYQILDVIASGSQGSVYRAHDPTTRQTAALKVLHPQMSYDVQVVERFRREASLAATVDHPNVTKILEVGTDGVVHFIAMEFLPNHIGEFFASQGQLPIEQAVDICRQTALALEAASHVGITHRDIKPQNLLLAADGSVKVADFGIAQWSGFASMTNAGDVVGTPKYMSPEQASGLRADARSDIYALGIVLYEALAGQAPFDSDAPFEVIRQHIEEMPEPVSARRPDVPPGLARVVDRCLEKDPANRFQTAGEFIRDLDLAMAGVDADASAGQYSARVYAGASAGIAAPFGGDPVTIGRDPTNDLPIDDPTVSRQHAVIYSNGSVVALRDLQSSNGTYVNNSRIVNDVPLNLGDIISVGNTHIVFEVAQRYSQPVPSADAGMASHAPPAPGQAPASDWTQVWTPPREGGA